MKSLRRPRGYGERLHNPAGRRRGRTLGRRERFPATCWPAVSVKPFRGEALVAVQDAFFAPATFPLLEPWA
jgi:hypothetical protein